MVCIWTDVDECLEQNIQCGANRMCFNMRGSYQCIDTPCPPNYQRDPTTGWDWHLIFTIGLFDLSNYNIVLLFTSLQVLLEELPTQWSGVRPEPVCTGVQAAVPALRHRRQSGPDPTGRLHPRWSRPSPHVLLSGGRGHVPAFCPAGREPQRRSVHHAAAAWTSHVPH